MVLRLFLFILTWSLWGQNASGPVLARSRAVVEQMFQGDYAAVTAQFSPVMKAGLSADQLKQLIAGLQSQMGAYRSLGTDLRYQRVGQHDVTIVPVQFASGVVGFQVAWSTPTEIGGLHVIPMPPVPVARKGLAVIVDGPAGKLNGTLLLPEKGMAPFAAVVLVHGSGTHDRDQTIGPNKPFLDLAEGLAARGVAVLRYDKRREYKPETLARLTVQDEVIDDALAAVKLLRTQPQIDPAWIFVLGHSLGGAVAPRIAQQDTRLAGLVLMAPSARDLPAAMLAQFDYLHPGSSDPLIESMRARATRAASPTLTADTPASELPGAPGSYFLDLRKHPPVGEAAAIPQPILVLQGERDYQVTVQEDYALWQKGLMNKKNVAWHLYPALNHLFLPGTGKSSPAEYNTPGHIPEQVFTDVASWLLEQKSVK